MINQKLFLSLALILSLNWCLAQTVPNFTITDSDGMEHKLYEDYLDQGTTVVLKIFFVDCPPCRSIAPAMQTLYEEWGEGEYDVQFLELSNKTWDSNADVAEYKSTFDLTFPGVGADGGSLTALEPYLNGDFGPFFGTPTFAVISPDKSIDFNTGGAGNTGKINNLTAAIEASGAKGTQLETDPITLNIEVKDAFGESITGVEAFIENATGSGPSYSVNLNQEISIQNFADAFPGITDPHLRLEKKDEIRKHIAPLDLLLIRKHILGIIPLTEGAQIIAADTNGDGVISPLDMLVLQKVILGIFTEFPRDSYHFSPNNIPLNLSQGQTENLNITAIKIGDLNGF